MLRIQRWLYRELRDRLLLRYSERIRLYTQSLYINIAEAERINPELARMRQRATAITRWLNRYEHFQS